MRKYLLPAAVCAALAAIVLLLVKRGEEPDRRRPTSPAPAAAEPPRRSPLGEPAATPTRLDEHRWLRELERALARDDLSNAHFYRQKVCEDIDTILASEKLTNALLDAIRRYGIESDDPRRRDVVLPMLRVVPHPEATRMVGEEYYRAKDDAERMTLLEAMAKPYHDPKQASVWAVERALNAASEEDRWRAFDLIKHYAVDENVIVDTAVQIYESTTDPKQREQVLWAIAERGKEAPAAREFTRRALRNPKPEELQILVGGMPYWADEKDAARLDELAGDFPAIGEILRQQANTIRRARKIQREGAAAAELAELERREMEERERQRQREEEERRKAEGGG